MFCSLRQAPTATLRRCGALESLRQPCSHLLQTRFFARELEDGSRGKKPLAERLLEYRADQDRLRDGWAWVGYWEKSCEKTLRHAKKLRRKLQYSSADPAGRAKREQQQAYWARESSR
eukprot:TRINITY_DN49639_c0_g1_i1.p1 TRINITY_DN49639_c0_g1~~TRINITY_DN49639_c0_g1_i1.p1  ORF type:complete len:118 (+),score=22.14 TRINITY_DN49639_c0_g1_i1:60-413(+)